ncbi:MAG: asparagine synthase (glutamine-hydrolyzing) [Oscillospiraceae bacterium]|jgi:asparagine synthase (glutamine-hydrolysing)|nr:asparagine synthase (glutamine-hydrolyzing) [Oscillospiraceae bacterium]
MCGIAGWVDYNQNLNEKLAIINKMSETISSRGPDENNIYSETHVLLAHRRLVVVDPLGGGQPMRFKRGNESYVLAYNGEIYNTKEVRNELILSGFKFNGYSDTEVILKSYVHWKESCVEHFNGIFAFAVWIKHEQKLFLARDRMGVKPLFFFLYNGGIVFGSQIKTLLANPLIKPIIKEEGLKEIFLLGPARTSGQGVIYGIKELKRAQYLNFSNSNFTNRTYWFLRAREFSDTKEEAVNKTRFLIFNAIKKQLVADVPLCCFLSGGLDSSIISKVTSDYYKKELKKRLTTYSVDYLNSKKYFTKNLFQPNSDNKYIKIMSKFINSDHKNIIINEKDLVDALDEAVIARDLPGMADIDSSLLLFCREIKKRFTVALSGECADEIFGGYPWYHDEKLLFSDCFPWSKSIELRKNIVKDGVFSNPEDYIKTRYFDTISNVDKLSGDSKLDGRIREMFVLNLDWFMQVLLDRKDRMSMYSGLEVRVPFCDHEIVEYAYNMPWKIKSLGGREKGIVRESMSGFLPDDILERKKSPYPKTHNPIYMKIISKKVRLILEEKNSVLNQIIKRDEIMRIAENPDAIFTPWYGQLMGSAQMLAYIVQLDTWFKKYNIDIE